MTSYAFATLEIRRDSRGFLEGILDVDSTAGWLGCCVVYPGSYNRDLETVAYDEADRRAKAAGLRLEWLRKI